jgi:hypothetical protein
MRAMAEYHAETHAGRRPDVRRVPASGDAPGGGGIGAEHPRLVFRNPEKVIQGWELARKQQAMFIEFFGSDLIVVPGQEVASRMNGFLTWCTRRVVEEAGSAASSLDADVAA